MSRLGWVAGLVASLLVVVIAAPVVAQSPSGSPGTIGEATVLVLQLRTDDGAQLTPDQVAAAAVVIEARLTALPADVRVGIIPGDRVRIDVGDATQADAVRRVATASGELRIVAVPSDLAGQVEAGGPLPSGMPIDEIVGPGHVVSARVSQDQMSQPAIDLELDDEAASAFDEFAAAHYGEQFAIVLDGTVRLAPTINATRFDGRMQVSGALDAAAAAELAAILGNGPLPVVAEPLIVCPTTAECPIPSPDPRSSTAP